MARRKLTMAQALQVMLYGDTMGASDLCNYGIDRLKMKAA